MAFVEYNPHPDNKRIDDCTIRALTKVFNKDWEQIYIELAFQGYLMRLMPDSKSAWGAYLFNRGFTQEIVPNTCPDCYTVSQFCEDYPQGTYVLATNNHVVAVDSGNYFDTWDSGDEPIVYVWRKGR